MTSFIELSENIHILFGVWGLLLCLAGIIVIVSSFFVSKNFRFACLTAIPTFLAYIFFQSIDDLYRYRRTGMIRALNYYEGKLPFVFWLILYFLITIVLLVIFLQIIRYNREKITPFSIKYCYDNMPSGICYWSDNGRVIFANTCMNQLCEEITNAPLLDGRRFEEAISYGVLKVNGKIWQVSTKDIPYKEENLHEIIATDITEIYKKTIALQKNNEDLAVLAKQLWEYNFSIDETIRKEEILQTKIMIHDEMNHLMLTTEIADPSKHEEMDAIFSMWERNAVLLCKEAERLSANDALNRLSTLAETLGVQLLWRDKLPKSLKEEQKELFFKAAQEAVINATKHASAKKMRISIKEKDKEILCCFENDGIVPQENINFAGGLVNLSLLARQQQATLTVKTGETFQMLLCFPVM